MYFEFVLYVFIAIGFLAGICRGVKREFFALLSLLAAFACVLFTYKPLEELLKNVLDIDQLYGTIGSVLSFIGITKEGLSYIIIGGVPFILVFVILTIIYKSLLFSAKKAAAGKLKEGSKFLGGLVGLLSGLVLGLFFMPLFGACIKNMQFNGYLVPFLLEKIPFFSEKLKDLVEFFIPVVTA